MSLHKSSDPFGSDRASSSRPLTTRQKAVVAVLAVCLVASAVLVPVSDWMLVPAAAVIGTIAGFSTGFGLIAQVFSGVFAAPPLAAAVLGALAGCLCAWLLRAMEVKGECGRSLVSALFDNRMWDGNVPGFACRLLIGTVIGYAVALALTSLGFFETGVTGLAAINTIVGGGSDLPGWALFISALVALIVTGATFGGCAGGITGAIVAALGSIGVGSALQGAAQEAAFRFFAPYRPSSPGAGFAMHVLAGTAIGAGQGIIVGGLSGGALLLLRLLGLPG